MVQQMILSAFSALGLQGKGKTITSVPSPWFVDSGATNHMTGTSDLLHNQRPYTGTQHIQVADGNNIPITTVGDISSFFRHVLVSPKLSTSLLSVGQMVDNNCDVHFFS